MIENKVIVLVAGGTGGHLFPAVSLGQALLKKGYNVHYIVDHRVEKYLKSLSISQIHVVSSSTFGKKNFYSIGKMLWHNLCGFRQSKKILKLLNPAIILGFGGYPTIPPLLAAKVLKIPSIIHEQNIVMGRANRFLAPMVKAIAGGFLKKENNKWAKKIVLVGNPLREEVLKEAKKDYIAYKEGEKFRLLIFAGSQGSLFFDKIFPKVFHCFSESEREKIELYQQSRGDKYFLYSQYKDLKMNAKIAPFFDDMPQKMADAHLIISRSGASTVSEISAIGRPSLLIPYPHALDHDQAENAKQLEKIGGATIMLEKDLTPEILANFIKNSINSPQFLEKQALNAKKIGNINALDRLIELVEKYKK